MGSRIKKGFHIAGAALLALLIFAIAGFAGAASPNSLSDVIVISDIDDTIRISNIHSPLGTLKNYLHSDRAFHGISRIFENLTSQGAQVQYVSSIPKPIRYLAQRFLNKSGFPAGRLWSRTSSSKSDHKTSSIREIMKDNPNARVILIGDNGEHDPQIFAKLQADAELGPRIQDVYIHELYKEALPPGQQPFFTAGDLSARLAKSGIVTEEFALDAVRSTESALHDRGRQSLVLPEFSEVSAERIGANFDSLIAEEKDLNLRAELRKLGESLAERASAARRSSKINCLKGALHEMPGAKL